MVVELYRLDLSVYTMLFPLHRLCSASFGVHIIWESKLYHTSGVVEPLFSREGPKWLNWGLLDVVMMMMGMYSLGYDQEEIVAVKLWAIEYVNVEKLHGNCKQQIISNN